MLEDAELHGAGRSITAMCSNCARTCVHRRSARQNCWEWLQMPGWRTTNTRVVSFIGRIRSMPIATAPHAERRDAEGV